MKHKFWKSGLLSLLALCCFFTAKAEFADFTIDLTQNPVAELPAGVTQISYPKNGASFNGAQHGWCWYAVEFAVDGPVDITLGACQYAASNSAYLEVDGVKVTDIETRLAACWDADKEKNVATYRYMGGAATLKLYCGQYCPFVEVKKVPVNNNFTIDLTQNPVAELPAGVTQISYPKNGASFNGAQHGWCWYAVEFTVTKPVDITLGSCQYAASNSAYLEVDGVKVTDIETRLTACWDADKEKNVTTYRYNGGPATLKLYCGQYCPFVEVKEVPSVNFTIDLTKNPVDVLPEGVSQISYPSNGVSFNGAQHGWCWYAVEFKVEQPVEITLGACQYAGSNSAYLEANGVKVTDIETRLTACWDADKENNVAKYTYKGEPATLKLYCGQYCPFVEVKTVVVEQEDAVITYFDADKTTVLKQDTVALGSALAYAVGSDKVTVAEGSKFRRWVNEKGVTVAEGTEINDNLKLYAKVTPVQETAIGRMDDYWCTATTWAPEDYDLIEFVDGKYVPAEGKEVCHGWNVSALKVKVAGNADILIRNCNKSVAAKAVITNEKGETVGEVAAKGADAEAAFFAYTGEATTLTFTYEGGANIHSLAVANAGTSKEIAKVQKEKTIYKTNFQDWDAVSASSSVVDVKKTSLYGEEITFSLYQTAVDPTGTNSKFTKDVCTKGYMQTAKTTGAYILTSAIKSVQKLELVQAATGGNRGITVFVKGDGDEDWVALHNISIAEAGGEKLTFDVNRTNCQIKFGDFTASQNGYILSLNITGMVEIDERNFTDFALNFQPNPYTVTAPEAGLPAGVIVDGEWHDNAHGYDNTVVTLRCDGPVKFIFGTCQYGGGIATIYKDGELFGTQTCGGSCAKESVFFVNKEEAGQYLIYLPEYCPFFRAEAADFIPSVTVTYFDTNGKEIGHEVVEGNSALKFKYTAEDVTVGEGKAFRGWFDGSALTAQKVAEGISLNSDFNLYAKATAIETVEEGSILEYDFTKNYWYEEDHELISFTNARYYNDHGWIVNAGGTINIQVAGKAYVTFRLCRYGNEATATLTDAEGNTVGSVTTPLSADNAAYTFTYDGPATTLTLTFAGNGAYVHGVKVFNVNQFVAFNESTGYYEIPAGDASSFILALNAASSVENAKIFLPNGTYDLGSASLTSVSGKNISIIGESMDGTIIKNTSLEEGIGKTATLINSAENLYMQDLTLWNAYPYNGSTGRAVCLQDCGKNTICKNVKMLSYQDTYYSNSASRFYWEDSEIHGCVDYLCGDGDVIFNRVTLVNESRGDSKDESVICAPYPSESCTWGYVFQNCTVETLGKKFSLGRSWGGKSKATYLNTTVNQPEKMFDTRFTVGGMNVAAYSFKEYNTLDKEGNVISPASNVINFTHDTGNKEYETILSAEEAAKYTIANIYNNEWAPDQIAAQVTDVAAGTVFLVDGKITTVAPTSGKVRIANGRGGFGPEVVLVEPKKIEAGVYYLQSKEYGKFFSRGTLEGTAWGSHASVNKYGIPVRFVENEDGSMTLYMADIYHENAAHNIYINGDYCDNGTQAKYEAIYDAEQDAFKIANKEGGYLKAWPNDYVDTKAEGESYWTAVTAEEYEAFLAADTKAAKDSVLAAAEVTADAFASYVPKAVTVTYDAQPTTDNAWTLTKYSTRDNSYFNYGNYGAEIYMGYGDYSQTVEGLAKGIYQVNVAALYRSTFPAAVKALAADGFKQVSDATVAINKTVAQITPWYNNQEGDNVVPNNTGEFVDNVDNYTKPVLAYVGEDGKMEIKVTTTSWWWGAWLLFNGIEIQQMVDPATGIQSVSVAGIKDGKYLQNGRLVIVKGGKSYDAKGMLIK